MLSNDNPLSAWEREERTCNNISRIVTSSFTKLSSLLSTIPFSTFDFNFVSSFSLLASPLRSSSNGRSIFPVSSPSKFFRNYKKGPEMNSSTKSVKHTITHFYLRFLLSHVYNLDVPITGEGYTNYLQWLLINKLLLFWG